jgi:hypothetical protein
MLPRIAAITAILVLLPLRSEAQSGPAWFALPTTTDAAQGPRLEQAATILTEALAARETVWGRAESRARFEERHSTKPGSLTRSDIEQWMERSSSALRNLARADYEAAQRDLLQAQNLTAGAIEELNREAEQARRLLDTCLYFARARFEGGDRDGAISQVRECRTRSPKASPSEGKHTPETLSLLADVDAERAKKPLGKIFVDSVPRGCTVRLNGFDYGATPRQLSNIIQGDYRVQVECAGQAERRGRIYRVTVGAEQANLTVDTRLDRAVESQPALALRYDSLADENTMRVRHAAEIARVLNSQHVLLLTMVGEDTIRLDRIDSAASSPVVASVAIPAGEAVSMSTAREAVQALLAPASIDLRQQPSKSMVTWQPPHGSAPGTLETGEERRAQARIDEPAEGPSRSQRIAGFSLIAAGGAGVVAGGVLYFMHTGDGHDFRTSSLETYLERQSAWRDSRPMGYALVAPSSAIATVGIGLAARPRASVPWWGWASGGVGLGLLAWGVADIATGGSCPPEQSENRTCVLDQEQRDRGALVALSSAPFLYLPVHQLLFREKPGPAVTVAASDRMLFLRGSF